MSKKIKLKNSTVLLVGILIISIGICTGLYEYFIERKNRTFSNMSILLYENEQPNNISDSVVIPEEDENISENEDEEIIENNDSTSNQEIPEPNYLGVLEIPKINLKNGFYDINSKYNNVDYNVTVISGSTYPDTEKNNLILAAHSGNCYVCYFDNLYKLELEDIAYVQYKGVKYTYEIVNIYEVEKDGTVEIHRDSTKNVLTLITCTRNSKTKQTVYILEQI